MITREYRSTNFITGLRSIAVLMVFLIHSAGGGIRGMFSFIDRIVDMGKYGVDIFFVISGFTIFYQFYKKKYSLKQFLVIRILRVSIPYFPLIIGLYFFILFGGETYNYWAIKFNDGKISLINLLLHIFYLSFLDIRYANTIIGVEWTLAIEVFYYFILGFLIYKINSLTVLSGSIKFLVFFFLIAIGTVAIGKMFSSNESHLFIFWLPFKYGYMFLLGGIAFHMRNLISKNYQEDKLKSISNIALIVSIIFFLFFIINTKIPNIGLINELVFTFLTFVLIVFVDENSKLTRILTNRFMIFIGSISFSFYLIHMLILKSTILDMHITNEGLAFLYYFCLAVIVSSAYYYLFEVKIYKKVKTVIKKRME